ncbi:lytic polysaccharide monooxygenase auxiliary activity family 9 protein [Amycolatopsis aidingensis]|uniref:lytic polysaccharide monooxygenase auxiliary activity family 9 protein n=1 Tax=Amycolatopsis aidingensis TaxID=2842453 RepID=UPI001C0A9FFE|nr:lytic polysaccharide monooxygenase [Amycolatopsis aidingensis]
MKKRRIAVLLAAATALFTVLVVLSGNGRQAAAHGALMQPGSRTFLCYQDGHTPQGNIVPQNPACADAVAESGANSLYNWFSVLRSDGAGRTEGFIPDGQLCSGGNPNFSGFDLPGTEWPRTHLTSGAPFSWSYNAWAAHPGWFYLYVTKDGWDPSQPLSWDDLEEEPFLTVDHPEVTGPVGSIEGRYEWSGTLPDGKTGDHIIYSVWERSDSAETFYGCSDVVFDGGNGEVTGIGEQQPPPSTDPTDPPAQDCMAHYEVTNSWSGGFQAEVSVHNHGTEPLNGWRVDWTLGAGQRINSLWDGQHTISGSAVTVRNADWNRTVAADGETSFGFVADATGEARYPAEGSLSCLSP